MTQTAQVKRIITDGVAEIAVTRQGACSHDCADCGGCSSAVHPTVTAMASNAIAAKAGDLVLVETPSHKLLGVAALVYLLPMLLLIVGYLVGQAIGFSGGLCILTGAGFFAVSLLMIVGMDRYVKAHRTLQFSIVGFKAV